VLPAGRVDGGDRLFVSLSIYPPPSRVTVSAAAEPVRYTDTTAGTLYSRIAAALGLTCVLDQIMRLHCILSVFVVHL